MVKCPVCGNDDDKLCNRCGYILENDYILHNLSYKLTELEIKEYHERIIKLQKIYDSNKTFEKSVSEEKEAQSKTVQDDMKELNMLGEKYEKGYGVLKDYTKAKKYYRKASYLGSASAKCTLGRMYKTGIGVKQDYQKAFRYYEQAAKLGDANATYNLGYMYEYGLGVSKNYSKALQYYEQAYEKGNLNAIGALCLMYRDGRGVESNYSMARRYYKYFIEAREYYDEEIDERLNEIFRDKKLESNWFKDKIDQFIIK